MDLELYEMGDEATRSLLRGIDKQGELNLGKGGCFWLGAVSNEDKRALHNFLKAAEEENLQDLIKQAVIADTVSYAILVQDAAVTARFHLFVIESGKGLWGPSKILVARKLSSELSVKVKPGAVVPEGFETHPKLEVWKSFIEGFFRK